MTWLVLLILAAIVLFLFMRKKSVEETAHPAPQLEVSGAPDQAVATGDDELMALIAAAIAEYEGSGSFQVVSIRPSGRSWAFTGRQELMHGRL
ncbi:MAG: hypothetical protein P4N59_15545 [Negativicutes bacterium]|nr:hypothetical protein [Negativicutes bacterium]